MRAIISRSDNATQSNPLQARGQAKQEVNRAMNSGRFSG